MTEHSASDDVLVADLTRGSEAALGLLYDRHGPAVHRTALRLGRDPRVAEEIVQETFLALWNRAEQFDPARGSLGAWLTVIARSRAIDRLRSDARRLPAESFSAVVGDVPDPGATVDWLMVSGTPVALGSTGPPLRRMVAAGESRAAITRALDLLTEDERRVIVLAYRDGLSQSEIAERLGCPLGTVKTRSRRALHRLRDALEMPVGDSGDVRGRQASATRPKPETPDLVAPGAPARARDPILAGMT